MAVEPWPVGTDTGERLRDALRAFIETQFARASIKARLPRKQHLRILNEGEREGAGISVRVVSQNDPKMPWSYPLGARTVVEDWHQIAVFVKADRKAGGAESVSAVFGTLRALFAARDSMDERQALETAGVHDCLETPEGLINEPGDPSEEGTFFKQQISLRCNTDCYLD